MKDVCRQGINGPIWALIAYDSGSYQIPVKRNDETQTTRQRLIEAILDGQLSDGGWDIASSSGDADMTGMALQALAPYYLKTADKIDEVDQAVLDRVKSAVDKGLTLISSIQEGDGGFSSMGGRSSESCCQIIVALSSLRIDLKTDKRFIKRGTYCTGRVVVLLRWQWRLLPYRWRGRDKLYGNGAGILRYDSL